MSLRVGVGISDGFGSTLARSLADRVWKVYGWRINCVGMEFKAVLMELWRLGFEAVHLGLTYDFGV